MNIKTTERALKALANKRRLEILKYLSRMPEATVGDVARHIKLSFKATSKHLGLLMNSDIIEKEQQSRMMRYRLSSPQSEMLKTILDTLR